MFEKVYRLLVRWSYILGIFTLIISLPNSKYGMGMAQFWLAGVFAFDRIDLRKLVRFLRERNPLLVIIGLIPYFFFLLLESIWKGLKLFAKNKPALIFSSILLLHLVGLLFTSDFSYALKDLRTKLPLFLIPLYISTGSTFSKKEFYWLMIIFVAATFVRTILNTWSFYHINLVDIREASKGVSHIIVSLLISLALFTLGWLVWQRWYFKWWVKACFILAATWFMAYLILMQAMTGVMVTVVTWTILLIILIFKSKKRWLKISASATIFTGIAVVGIYLGSVYSEYHRVNPIDLTKLDSITSRGNKYIHNTKDLVTENGNYLWIYIQWDEMREEWSKRSSISLDSNDNRNQQILNTLVRYLTSKGVRKDGDAVAKLTNKEVRAIENGVANVIFIDHFGLKGRIYEFINGYEEYLREGNPTGSSVMQRFEFWKASLGIIKENWLTGVGTGDMNEAFQDQYIKMGSKLAPDQRWRSHDQFLSIFVGLGIFGLIWFLLAILIPAVMTGRFNDYFFLVFLTISLVSMFPEDTIENQAGVTFFAFFYSFFMWGKREADGLP